MPNRKLPKLWHLKFVNFLGALGYIACLLQWAWAAMLYMNTIASSDAWKFLTKPQPAEKISDQPMINLDPTLAFFVGILITIVVVAVMIIVMWRLPKTIATTGSNITRATAKNALPIIARHKKIPEKQKRQLIERLTWSVKIILVLLPVIAILFSRYIHLETTYSIAVAMEIILALLSLWWFGLQYIATRLLRVNSIKIW